MNEQGWVVGASQLMHAAHSAHMARRSVLDDFQDLVGVEPDAVVARSAGLTVEAVRLYRVRRGIPSAAQVRKSKAAPNTRAAARRSDPSCWKVTVQGSDRALYVVGALVEAAEQAERATGQDLIAIEYVGQALQAT